MNKVLDLYLNEISPTEKNQLVTIARLRRVGVKRKNTLTFPGFKGEPSNLPDMIHKKKFHKETT